MGRIARTGSSPEKLFTINIACRQSDWEWHECAIGKATDSFGPQNDTCA